MNSIANWSGWHSSYGSYIIVLYYYIVYYHSHSFYLQNVFVSLDSNSPTNRNMFIIKEFICI